MTDEATRYQQALLRVVQGRPIAFYSAYAHALGSVTAALLLSQLCYWSDKGHSGDGWIYKTRDELKAETGLSREEQETARRKLRAAGILAEKRAGVPARLYYRVDFERLVDLLAQTAGMPPSSWRESGNQDSGNAADIHSETTAETTRRPGQRASRDPADYFRPRT